MSGPQFFQTRMGQQYYDATLPRIADALERIAKALENPEPKHKTLADACAENTLHTLSQPKGPR